MHCRRGVADDAVGVDAEDRIGDVVGQQAIAALALLQGEQEPRTLLQRACDRQGDQEGGGEIELEEL